MTSNTNISQETILEMKPYIRLKQIGMDAPINCGDELMSELNDLLDYQELKRNESANRQSQQEQGKEE